MQLQQLQAVLEVAITGSINAAAKKMNVSQPSLSRFIKNLEKEIGIVFFERTHTGVALTKEGEYLLPYILRVINDIDQFSKEAYFVQTHLCSDDEESLQSLRIITLPLVNDLFIMPALVNLKQSFPDTQIEVFLISDLGKDTLVPQKRGDIVIAYNYNHALDVFFSSIRQNSAFVFQSICTERFYVIMSSDHPLSKKRVIHWEDLIPYSVIQHNNGLDELFFKQVPDSIQDLHILLRSNNPQVISHLLHQTQAVFITSSYVSRKYYDNNVFCIRPFQNLESEWFCIYRKEDQSNCAIFELVSMLKYLYAVK